MKEETVIFMGRSGCGKGTQARKLAEYLTTKDPGRKIVYVSTGSLFREFIKGEGYSQDLSRQMYSQSLLQPTFLAVALWADQLIKEMKGNEHLMFDGAPRTQAEAELIYSALTFYKRENVHVVNLDVSREWAMSRLSERGRKDDQDIEEVNRRMNWYQSDVVPAINHLESKGFEVVRINGEQDIEGVHQDVINRLQLS